MRARVLSFAAVLVAVGYLSAPAVLAQTAPRAQKASQAPKVATGSLGTVHIPERVMANGQPLAAGTYVLRLSNDAVDPVVGQGADAAKWVEFLQGGQVKGRELASVVAPADVKAVAKGAPPSRGRSRVQLLRGATYVRVWVNDGGTQYLVHLVADKKA